MAATATVKVAASGIWLAGRSTAMVLLKSTTTASLSRPQPEAAIATARRRDPIIKLGFCFIERIDGFDLKAVMHSLSRARRIYHDVIFSVNTIFGEENVDRKRPIGLINPMITFTVRFSKIKGQQGEQAMNEKDFADINTVAKRSGELFESGLY